MEGRLNSDDYLQSADSAMCDGTTHVDGLIVADVAIPVPDVLDVTNSVETSNSRLVDDSQSAGSVIDDGPRDTVDKTNIPLSQDDHENLDETMTERSVVELPSA